VFDVQLLCLDTSQSTGCIDSRPLGCAGPARTIGERAQSVAYDRATATAQGDLMVRCDPARVDDLLDPDGASWPSMRGRTMSKGWIVVEAARVASDDALRYWIEEALAGRRSRATGQPQGIVTALAVRKGRAT
jgi:hypothetical protein